MSSVQKKVIFHSDACIQCHACQMACKMWRNTERGIYFRRIEPVWETDDSLGVRLKTRCVACMHCEHPLCVTSCPAGAIRKRPEDGVVIVDETLCTGCGSCALACPFAVPQIGADGKMKKCDLCQSQDVTQDGGAPSCVRACPTGALIYQDGVWQDR